MLRSQAIFDREHDAMGAVCDPARRTIGLHIVVADHHTTAMEPQQDRAWIAERTALRGVHAGGNLAFGDRFGRQLAGLDQVDFIARACAGVICVMSRGRAAVVSPKRP